MTSTTRSKAFCTGFKLSPSALPLLLLLLLVQVAVQSRSEQTPGLGWIAGRST